MGINNIKIKYYINKFPCYLNEIITFLFNLLKKKIY